MKTSKSISLLVVLVLIVLAIAFIQMHKVGRGTFVAGDDTASSSVAVVATSSPSRAAIIAQKTLEYPKAKEIVDPTGFLNTGGLPITIGQYIGKDVVLVDFWTYSCINCQRTLPYTTTWYGKYKDHGFVIIGIHTPEFDFEKDINNVALAAQKFGIEYPIVLDSDYGTWNAYGNEYWPREYLIDIDGFIREDHIGEGGYSDTETAIQNLLKERDQELGITDTIPTSLVTNPAPQSFNISLETYFGAERGSANDSDLSGSWNIMPEYAESTGSGKLVFPYTAKYVYVVASSSAPTDITVLIDGKPAGNLSGSDVSTKNGNSTVTVSGARLYNLVSDTSVNSHAIELQIPNPGVDVFTLTFGS